MQVLPTFLLILLLSMVAVAQDTAKEKLEQANSRLNMNDRQDAIALYEELVAADYTPAMAMLGEARLTGYQLAENQERGIELLKKAAAREDPHALAVMGYLYLKGELVKPDPQRALTYAKKALADGNHYLAFATMAQLQLKGTGVPADARQAAETAKSGLDKQVESNYEMTYELAKLAGDHFYQKADYDNAARFYLRYLEGKYHPLTRDDYMALHIIAQRGATDLAQGLGNLYELSDNIESAIEYYEIAARDETSTTNGFAKYRLGLLLDGDEGAFRYLTEAVAGELKDIQRAGAYARLAQLHRENGALDKAMEMVRQALNHNDDTDAVHELFRIVSAPDSPYGIGGTRKWEKFYTREYTGEEWYYNPRSIVRDKDGNTYVDIAVDWTNSKLDQFLERTKADYETLEEEFEAVNQYRSLEYLQGENTRARYLAVIEPGEYAAHYYVKEEHKEDGDITTNFEKLGGFKDTELPSDGVLTLMSLLD